MTASRERFGLRRALVVAQVALSLVLLLGALLFSRTLYNLLATDPGFAHERLVVASVTHLSRVWRDTSGERGASSSDAICASGSRSCPKWRRSRRPTSSRSATAASGTRTSASTAPPSRERRVANFNRVSEGFFRSLEIPFVPGRDFDDRDTLQSPAVAIVSERFVSTLLNGEPNRSAAARRRSAARAQPPQVFEIVGVVNDTLRHRACATEIAPMVYLASTQEAGARQRHAVRHSAARRAPRR